MDKPSPAVAGGMQTDEFYAVIKTDGAPMVSLARRPGEAPIAGGLAVVVRR